jgi:hypothetical protein
MDIVQCISDGEQARRRIIRHPVTDFVEFILALDGGPAPMKLVPSGTSGDDPIFRISASDSGLSMSSQSKRSFSPFTASMVPSVTPFLPINRPVAYVPARTT